ncbi:MAG TPA: YceI family protein [Chitinophagaceae bacterium]|nr:YceI family protein [Chitinophagaceae bacterium]
MKKLLLPLLIIFAMQVNAQKYFTKTGSIYFLSKAPLETIDGNNKSVACLLESKSGAIDFIVQIKSFVFDKQLLQEHFNENYMESEKYPKATFKGRILNMSSINLSKDGEYDAKAEGKLTIHGVTHDVNFIGKISVKGGKVTVRSDASVLLADYNIAIPGAVKDKISKDVKIKVNCTLEPLP